MTTPSDEISKRKLMNALTPVSAEGEIEALLATTFDLDAEFFETDFLPAVFGMRAWNNKNWSSRIMLERKLALAESATVWMEAERYGSRPRSLRVEVVPVKRPVGKLHAKVTVLVYAECVRLLVGSANLTERGYRHNREVAVDLTANARNPEAANMIADALERMPRILNDWWTDSASRACDLALNKLSAWRTALADAEEWFIWSGVDVSLWPRFLSHWPENEQIQSIKIVSPFWAESPESNFLNFVLGSLRERGLLAPKGATLQLFTEACPIAISAYMPVLPEAYGAFNFGSLGVIATAHAVDPRVNPDEIDFQGDFIGRRSLHAKVMLLEGASASLAYVGSANFTHRGWGLGIPASQANIEAGIVLRRTGRRRTDIDGILPATIGDPVPLTGQSTSELAKPEPMTPENPWPIFLRSVSLRPSVDPRRLELHVLTWPDRVEGTWRISVEKPGEDGIHLGLLRNDGEFGNQAELTAELNMEVLNALLLQQEVIVHWWGSDASAHFPLNVALAARHDLPIAPGNARLEEHHMLAYYQGKVTWEDLFPDPDDPAEKQRLEAFADLDAGVDTSGIQSYQIREFVEALHGIAQDLKQHSYSAASMRLALRGPVSPLRLAQSAIEAASSRRRTPVGVGFQLVELLACLDQVRDFDVSEHLQQEWNALIQEAQEELEAMLEILIKSNPSDFTADDGFVCYRRAVRKKRGHVTS